MDWSGLVNGYYVEVSLDTEGYWLKDKVIIYDPEPILNEDDFDAAYRLPHKIIQYLYDEAIIKDRRTKFQVVRDSGPPDEKT